MNMQEFRSFDNHAADAYEELADYQQAYPGADCWYDGASDDYLMDVKSLEVLGVVILEPRGCDKPYCYFYTLHPEAIDDLTDEGAMVLYYGEDWRGLDGQQAR